MAEENPVDPTNETGDTGAKAQRSILIYFRALMRSISILVVETLRIEDNAHPEETIDSIKKDIEFKGYNVWILIFSIFIASIGLNVNSTAVIIGAMLISPLMGPILGVGLSVGINDWQTLKHSLRHFAIMFSVSILASAIYFFITPLADAQSEILSRTQPTLLDVFIALFGGLAGILAANRKIKTNVIPGVAIATALMPPLCTAGYGLATAQWNFFFGAFYLFIINSIFISLATFIIVRFLKFPVKEFMDPLRERRAKRYIFLFLLLVVIPSGYIFFNVVKESIFTQRAERFITENVIYEGMELVKNEVIYSEDGSEINLIMIGDIVPEKVINSWRSNMGRYSIDDCTLNVTQGKEAQVTSSEEVTKLVDIFSDSQAKLRTKDDLIEQLQYELKLERGKRIPFSQISQEIRIQFRDLADFGYSEMIHTNYSQTDTIITVDIRWNEGVDADAKSEQQKQLLEFLKVRLQREDILLRETVFEYPIDTTDSIPAATTE